MDIAATAATTAISAPVGVRTVDCPKTLCLDNIRTSICTKGLGVPNEEETVGEIRRLALKF